MYIKHSNTYILGTQLWKMNDKNLGNKENLLGSNEDFILLPEEKNYGSKVRVTNRISEQDEQPKKPQKTILSSIKEYGNMLPFLLFKHYGNALSEYSSLIKGLKPSKLYKYVKSYNNSCNPSQRIPRVSVWWICLLFPILLAYLGFILGLILVLTIPPIVFLVGMLFWISFWPIVIIAPPVIYIGGKLVF